MVDAVFMNKEEVDLVPIYYDPVHDFGFYRFDPKAVKFMEVRRVSFRVSIYLNRLLSLPEREWGGAPHDTWLFDLHARLLANFWWCTNFASGEYVCA